MRTKTQIKQQLKQVTFRHLQRLLRQNFKKKPQTCTYNNHEWVDPDLGYGVSLCDVKEEGLPRNVVCDPRVEGCNNMARECPLWAPCRTKEQVKEDFHAVIQSSDRGLIASDYPDIAALLWVLDDPEESDVPSKEEVEEAVQEEPEEEEEPPPVTSSWFAGFLGRKT